MRISEKCRKENFKEIEVCANAIQDLRGLFQNEMPINGSMVYDYVSQTNNITNSLLDIKYKLIRKFISDLATDEFVLDLKNEINEKCNRKNVNSKYKDVLKEVCDKHNISELYILRKSLSDDSYDGKVFDQTLLIK